VSQNISNEEEHPEWVLCPICLRKTRIRIRTDTILVNFPLYCPKCKQETLISATHKKIEVVSKLDAKDAELMKE